MLHVELTGGNASSSWEHILHDGKPSYSVKGHIGSIVGNQLGNGGRGWGVEGQSLGAKTKQTNIAHVHRVLIL